VRRRERVPRALRRAPRVDLRLQRLRRCAVRPAPPQSRERSRRRSAGCAVVTADDAYLFTDGRYFLQAEQQLDRCVPLA
jgi:hypothetical protein